MRLWSTPGGRRLLAMIALSTLAACTSVPAPVQDVAEAEHAVQAAADAGAETVAPTEFKKARGKLEAAKSALQAQQHLKARQLAEQALVDAERAQVTAEAEAGARAAAEIRARIRNLGGSSLGMADR